MNLNDLLVLYVYDKNSSFKEILPILEANFKKVFIAKNIHEAQKNYKKYSPCIIVVDDSFENKDMLLFLQKVRQGDLKTAFVVLTQNQANSYVLELMELYITKYIQKPFDENKFLLALNKCLEIIESRIYSNVELGNNVLFNFQNQSIIKDGKAIVLNKKESILINLFIQNQNRVISYEELEYHIWDNECTEAALKSLIRDFRRKTYKDILKNFSGLGYKLNLQKDL